MNKYRAFLIFIFILSLFSVSFAAEVKEADLAGSWYSASTSELESMLQGYLSAANPEKIDGQVFAIISPHAGYKFSGPVAAYGFKALQGEEIKTVIVLGFSHQKYFDGIAIYDRGVWQTPIGAISIDEALAKDILSKSPRFRFEPDLFKEENSVEMQVPFIQMVFKNAKIVPITFGTQKYEDAETLAQALVSTLKDKTSILIVASTDMSHYHPYDDANSIDKHTIQLLDEFRARELYDEGRLGICELCGLMPVTATLLTAKGLGYNKMKILKYANSGDTFGDKTRVVGYVSAVVYKESPGASTVNVPKEKEKKGSSMLSDSQRKRLLQIARESIESYVRDGKRKQFSEEDPLLKQSLGAFVTLNEGGELRGCIGNMVGQGPLYQTVADMAVEAATGDPRFPALSPKEIDKIVIEVSVLSPLRKVTNYQEIKIPGDGVLVRKGFRSGVYLPQVATETGWNRDEFLTSLCAHKAGLPPDAWKDPATEICVFTAEVFNEKGE